MNIILTGMMGSGKTSVGKILAKKLHMSFLDMDEEIEKQVGKKISQIFSLAGEAKFRQLERNLVNCLSLLDKYVISTGGGVVLDKRNIEDFRKNGKIVYLYGKPEVLFERIKKEKNRPLLKVENPFEEFKKIFTKRENLYLDCDVKISVEDKKPEQIADEIIRTLHI